MKRVSFTKTVTLKFRACLDHNKTPRLYVLTNTYPGDENCGVWEDVEVGDDPDFKEMLEECMKSPMENFEFDTDVEIECSISTETPAYFSKRDGCWYPGDGIEVELESAFLGETDVTKGLIRKLDIEHIEQAAIDELGEP